MLETGEVGQRVRISTEPACPQEMRLHAQKPYREGSTGTIEAIVEGDHCYEVAYLLPTPMFNGKPLSAQYHEWFAPWELEAAS